VIVFVELWHIKYMMTVKIIYLQDNQQLIILDKTRRREESNTAISGIAYLSAVENKIHAVRHLILYNALQTESFKFKIKVVESQRDFRGIAVI